MGWRAGLMLIMLCLLVFLASAQADPATNGTFVSLVEIDVSMPEPLEGDVLVMEKWHYHFDEATSSVFRTIPAGYNAQRSTHCDAIGQIFVFDGDDLRRPLPEVAPSLFHHQAGSFEVLEDPDHLHVHVYFPPTQGAKTIVISYRVRGGVQLAMMPLLHWGPTSVDKFIWNAVAGNNPMAVHNMTMKFSSQLSSDLRPSIYPRAPIASKFITSKPSMTTLDSLDKEGVFTRLTGWKAGTPPLPPYTPYNYNMVFRARDQLPLLRISSWQRDHLFQNLMDQTVGVGLLLMVTAPYWYLLFFRKPWVVDASHPAHSPVGGAVELRLLVDGPAGLDSDLVHLDVLQALQQGMVTYSPAQDTLQMATGKSGSHKNILPVSLQVLLDSPNRALPLSDYSKLVRKKWTRIQDRAMNRLCQEGWYRHSVFAVRQQYTLLVGWQWIVTGAMLAFPYLFRCARWWMTSQSLYILLGLLALSTGPLRALLYPLTVAGVQCVRGWHAHLQSLAQRDKKDAALAGHAYEYFAWRSPRSQERRHQWAQGQSSQVQALMKQVGWL